MVKYSFYILFTLLLVNCNVFSQGLNHNWLLGYLGPPYNKARISFTDTSATVLSEVRKMPFTGATQGNISDRNGNLLMSSNGVWVADATGDTMVNGSGLNPNSCTSANLDGLPFPNVNLILPMPDDSNLFIMIHQTGNYSSPFLSATEIYYTIIDITKNGGLGEVVSKNNVLLNGLFGLGMGACKHANGRDWWIVAFSDSATIAYKFLIKPNNFSYEGSEILGVPGFAGWAGQVVFSPNGSKLAYTHSLPENNYRLQDSRLFDFDRCTGHISNTIVTQIPDSIGGFGIAFAPNSKYLYVASFINIYQINADSSNVAASMQLVAENDTFASPAPPFYTDFMMMYLAANGKIYLTSGGSVEDLHYINYPDSTGILCDVRLHDLHLPTLNIRTNPFHPSYYLGPVTGSICDSLTTGLVELEHDFNFSVAPNPNTGLFKIMYLLPQNESGKLRVYDVTGRVVYSMRLSPWSTLQNLNLSHLKNGLYHVTITSDNFKESKKLVILN